MHYPEYPFASAYASINGQRMHYLDEGDRHAPPLVMVHGNPSWSFFFRQPVMALRGSCRCIVPDHIGMGLSDKPAEDSYEYTLDRRIDDLEALLAELDVVSNITLMLHDWGGMIGMGYACRHPERISRLIIMNTAAYHLPRDMHFPWQLTLARSPAGPLLVRGLNAFCRGAVRYCVTRRPMPAAVAAAYLAPYDSWAHRLAVLRFIQDIPLRPGDRSYATVSNIENTLGRFESTPMLICWGMQDFIFSEAFLNEWCRRFQHAEVHRYADAGHYLLEDAADEVIAAVQNFISPSALQQG